MFGTFPDDILSEFYAAYAEKSEMPCNKPRMEQHGNKRAVVKACYNGKEKMIRFGDANSTTAGEPKEGESDSMKARRASFKARHAKNIARGPQSGAYWANRFLW